MFGMLMLCLGNVGDGRAFRVQEFWVVYQLLTRGVGPGGVGTGTFGSLAE